MNNQDDVGSLTTFGLPPEASELFRRRGINNLNQVQKAAIREGLLEERSVLVSAPTSSGKTLIGELLALKHAGSGLTAYLVSHKALAREVFGIFKTWYIADTVPLLRAGLVTGDEDTVHGEWSQVDLVISTYEKFYSVIIGSGSPLERLKAVVVDEMQILGDVVRGPALELLVARLLFHQRTRPLQILGLSATVPNSSQLADWLDANCVDVRRREPPLEHEIWLPGQRLCYLPTQNEPQPLSHNVDVNSIGEVVESLLEEGRGPIVVMATTKPDAREFASEIVEFLPVDSDFPREIVDDFRAMGEGTDESNEICGYLPRRLGVHHADLTPEQLAVIEKAFRDRQLTVMVATTTLVAGVNLPIRTVVYPKMTRWAGQEEYIDVREYVNGSGRAGRQGYFEVGTSVICAPSLMAAHRFGQHYVKAELDRVESRLEGRSKEFLAMHLLAALPESKAEDLAEAASKTLWGYERGFFEDTARKAELTESFRECLEDTRWACCFDSKEQRFSLTEVGRAVVATGFPPSLALESFHELQRYAGCHGSEREKVMGLRDIICRLCLTEGIDEHLPHMSQFRLDWARVLQEEIAPRLGISGFLSRDIARVIVGAAHALIAIGDSIVAEEIRERMLSYRGERNRIAEHLSWLLRAACLVAEAEDAQKYETEITRLTLLAEQLRFQVPAEAVDLSKLFSARRVPNVGTRKTIKLARLSGGEISDVIKLTDQQLASAVGEKQVAGVRKAALDHLGGLAKEQSRRQIDEASRLPSCHALVESLLYRTGKGFEAPVREALCRLGWEVEVVSSLDDSPKPDLVGYLSNGEQVWVECKTTDTPAAEISQKEAFDTLKKPIPFDVKRIFTVGRPRFSTSAVLKALDRAGAAQRLQLVTAGGLIEILLGWNFAG